MSTELVTTEAGRFCPVMTIQDAKNRYNDIVQFTKDIMKEGKDYGTVPGTDKPTLLKPGAEKLCSFFGLAVEDPDILTEIEDWTGEKYGGEPFFYYKIMQRVTRNGTLIASQIASCNSRESKYRYRWVTEQGVPAGTDKNKLATRDGRMSEFAFAIDKGETSGPYGKPEAYWKQFRDAIANGTAKSITRATRSNKQMAAWEIGTPSYRIPNDNIFDLVNTIQKMAAKRALVAASLIACNASEYYTQDIEDLDILDVPFTPVATSPHKPASKAEQMANGLDKTEPLPEGVDAPAPEDLPPINAATGPDFSVWQARILAITDYKTGLAFLREQIPMVPQGLRLEAETLLREHMAAIKSGTVKPRQAPQPQTPPHTQPATTQAQPTAPSPQAPERSLHDVLIDQWRNAINTIKTRAHAEEFRQFMTTCPAEVKQEVAEMLSIKEGSLTA